jgi:hypothetical protein
LVSGAYNAIFLGVAVRRKEAKTDAANGVKTNLLEKG